MSKSHQKLSKKESDEKYPYQNKYRKELYVYRSLTTKMIKWIEENDKLFEEEDLISLREDFTQEERSLFKNKLQEYYKEKAKELE